MSARFRRLWQPFDVEPGNVFSLPLFPESLASSVTTTVWVGVTVAVLFTLRFGWNLSGLVVPGYLTPLLLVKPLSAAVVVIEGILTYLLVYGFSERCSRYGWWSSLFGRDRFFGLVLVSVGVRLGADGWLWPEIGALWNEYFRQDFDYRSDLHSFGLIVVSLIANQFWKTGVIRGSVPVFTTVALTYLIVRYGLMEFTNFSIGNLGYTYDNLAASLLATPKAYIVLLTTAFLASRMNLYYGWEFNGILIPSLLALQWYQPAKILSSFLEAFLILGVARLLLRVPLVAALHLEGPRELLFFFNLGFFYKLALGWLLPLVWPTAPIMDIYGFGYMLTTLIAMRIHDKEIAARLTRATLQTSLVAVGIASIAGFALTLLPENRLWLAHPPSETGAIVRSLTRPLAELLNEDNVEIQRSRLRTGALVPLLGELEAFRTGLEQIQAHLHGEPGALEQAAQQLAAARYRLYHIGGRYLYLREMEPTNGWGIYVIDTRASGNLLVEVPAPLDEQNTLAAGSGLFQALSGRALAIAGTPRAINPDGSLDVLRTRQTPFHIFHQVMARRDVLQVRAYTARNSAKLASVSADAFRAGTEVPPTALWIRATLPPGVDLVTLQRLAGDLQVRWAITPLANLQRDITESGFAELVLNRPDLRQLLARAPATASPVATPLEIGEARIDGYLREWLLADKNRLAGRGTALYRPPRPEDLLYFDEEVLTPLLELLRGTQPNGQWETTDLVALQALAGAAQVAGYRLLRYRHRPTQQEHLILVEDETQRERGYRGTYVFRAGGGQPYVIAVPHPLFEANTFEYGVSLYEQLQANVLLLAGAHPQANADGTADVTDPSHPGSLFTLVNEVVLRETRNTPWLTTSVRAYGLRPGGPTPTADVLLAWHSGATRQESVGPLGQQLLKTLEGDGLDVRFVAGAAETAGYEASSSPQARYVNAAANKAFAALWLSSAVRATFAQQSDNTVQEAQFTALGITTRREDLYTDLAGLPKTAGGTPAGWRAIARAYLERRDIVSLHQLRAWPGLRYQRLLDRDTQQAFLLVSDASGRLRLVVNLLPRQPDSQIMATLPLQAATVDEFKNARAAWLVFGAP